MSYKSIANPAITVDEAQDLDRSSPQTFESAHHNGKVRLGSKLLATLPTESEKSGLVNLPSAAEKASLVNIPSAAELARIPSAAIPSPSGNASKFLKVNSAGDGYEAATGTISDGSYPNQVLEWDGSAWTPFGFRDTFDTDGDDTALDARWVTKTLPGTASVTISSNVCTINSDSGTSNAIIATGELTTAPIFVSCYVQLAVAPTSGDNARLQVSNGSSYLAMAIRRDGSNYRITAEDASTIRGNYTFGTDIADAKAWVGAVVDKYTIRYLYSLNAANDRPNHWEWVQLYTGATPAGMSGSVFQLLAGSAGGSTSAQFQAPEVARPY